MELFLLWVVCFLTLSLIQRDYLPEFEQRKMSHNWVFIYSEAKKQNWFPLSWQRNEGSANGPGRPADEE